MCHSTERGEARGVSAQRRAYRRAQRALIVCAHHLGALAYLIAPPSPALAEPKAPKELTQAPQLSLRPASPERPSGLVGVWEGAGVRLTLTQSGRAEVSERAEAQGQPAETWRLIERTRWWVEGAQLCLLAGLERACEPYQLSQDEARGLLALTLRGLSLIKRP